MLILAMPKSASTSLMATLGRLHHIPAEQTFFPDRPRASEIQVLHLFHSDVRELDDATARMFGAPGKLFKQHVPPTENNRRLLREQKKIILLRDPDEVVEAYYRGFQRSLVLPPADFAGCADWEGWRRLAETTGLLSDLNTFKDGWVYEQGDNLVIWYRDLVQSPGATINGIEAHFGMPLTEGPIVLDKKRYTRHNWIMNALRNRKWQRTKAKAVLTRLGLMSAVRRFRQILRF